MISLRTLVGGLCVAAGMAQATSLPISPTQRAEVFATCTGRLSALTEHQWMTDGPASEHTAEMRDRFADLLDAVAAEAIEAGLPPGYLMDWRLRAKLVQRDLLSDALFSEDSGRRDRAAKVAETNVATCRALILQS